MFKKIAAYLIIACLLFPVDAFAQRSRGSSGFSGGSSRSSSSGSSRSSYSGSSSRSSGSSSFSGSRSSGSSSYSPSKSSGSRSSGSSSFGSSPSKSSSSSSWFSGSSSSSPTPSKSTGFSSSSSSSFKPKPSTPTDLQVAKQVRVGNVTMDKSQAVADFKTKHASTYTSNYKTEPATRPSHIPTSTTVDGRPVNVTYNVNHGGYGYMHPLTGAWMAYDIMSDAVMMSAIMHNNHGYAPVVTQPVVYSSGYSTFNFIGTILLTIMLIGGIILFACFVTKV